MVKVRRLLKDYCEAGSLNDLVALWGFIDEHTFLTKAGALGLAYRVNGVDFEGCDHRDRQAIARQFEQALRQLDESFRVYQYVIKRPAGAIATTGHPQPVVNEALQRRAAFLPSKADSLFELDLYLVILYEGWSRRPTIAARLGRLLKTPHRAAREHLSTSVTVSVLTDELNRAAAHLYQKAQAFTVQLADTVGPM